MNHKWKSAVSDLNNIDDGEWKAQMDARPKASKASEFVVVAVIVPFVSIGLHLNWTTTGATRAALASIHVSSQDW